ncbi:MAG: hypothetical protein ACUVUB_02630 [Candidatus Bathyarchaeia archaeon]
MRIIMIGCGNVGRAFLNLLHRQKDKIEGKIGFKLQIVAIVDRRGGAINPEGLDAGQILDVKLRLGSVAEAPGVGQYGLSACQVISEVEAETVVELTSTNPINGQPGLKHVEHALKGCKHVVTTNKGPPALAMRS